MNTFAISSENTSFSQPAQERGASPQDTFASDTKPLNDPILDSTKHLGLLLEAYPNFGATNTFSQLNEDYRKKQISAADTIEAIAHALETLELNAVSKRLGYLNSVCDDDDPDQAPFNIDSVRSFALFMVESYKFIPTPKLGIRPDGALQAYWRFGEDHSAVMDFFPEDKIGLLAMSSGLSQPQVENVRVNDTLPKDLATIHFMQFAQSVLSSS